MRNDIHALFQQFLDGDLDPQALETLFSQFRDARQSPKIMRILTEYWEYTGLKDGYHIDPGEKEVLQFSMRKKLDKIIEKNRQHFKEMVSATEKVDKDTKR